MSKLIVTTSWDDGSKFDLKLARLLEKYSIKGTFYIPQTYLDNPLKENEIRILDKGHEVGSHTLSHVVLTHVSLEEARRQIDGSKRYLEELLGHHKYVLCYPKGCYNDDIKEMVKDCGFIAARTCQHGGFNLPEDPYEWQITLHASNGSPQMTFNIWRINHLSLKSLIDWETRAKELFDLALRMGGVYHLWGHSWEFERNHTWDKLERVLSYISNRDGVRYMTNGEIFRSQHRQEESSE